MASSSTHAGKSKFFKAPFLPSGNVTHIKKNMSVEPKRLMGGAKDQEAGSRKLLLLLLLVN